MYVVIKASVQIKVKLSNDLTQDVFHSFTCIPQHTLKCKSNSILSELSIIADICCTLHVKAAIQVLHQFS